MAGPTGSQSRLIAEIEYHTAALDELLSVYEYAMHKAITAKHKDTRHIAWLAARIEYTAAQLLAAKERRTTLRYELQGSEGL